MAVCPHCRIHYNKEEDGCCPHCGHPYDCECNGLEDESEEVYETEDRDDDQERAD